jgi:hypothetical protein
MFSLLVSYMYSVWFEPTATLLSATKWGSVIWDKAC